MQAARIFLPRTSNTRFELSMLRVARLSSARLKLQSRFLHRSFNTMTSSHPVILCGKTEAIGAAVIENLRPEFEVIQFIQTVDAGKSQIPALLRGEKPESPGSSLGSKNYAMTPVAVFLGAAFNDQDIQELRRAAEGAKKVPWLRPDTTKAAPPPGPEYGKAVVARIKETVKGLEERKELEGNGDVVWF